MTVDIIVRPIVVGDKIFYVSIRYWWMLEIRNGNFVQGKRTLRLHGLNIDGGAKMPAKPRITTFQKVTEEFWEGDDVSFVGRPFPLEEADKHFAEVRSWGHNTLRYVFTWEAIEHSGPGRYDDEFIAYTVEVLKKARQHGFLVFLDPHQDVWGRFSGGSGAPMWTYYAVGLNPKNFWPTRAAVVQNSLDDPENAPKMVWPTNYYRAVCQTMFALFFGGKQYAPKCVLNGENIQDFLQNHLLNACIRLYRAIQRAGLMEDCVFGVETLNEPNPGIIGTPDITKIPANQNLRLSSTPTAFESMVLATGHAQRVEYYDFGSLGPRFRHHRVIDPKGISAWLSPEELKDSDKRYGIERSKEWTPARCIWALHGVWDDTKLVCLQPEYFGGKVDEDYFTCHFFKNYWASYFRTVRKELGKDIIILCQPPTLFKPPNLKGTDLLDDRVVYSPHFYDGLTLMLKRWSSVWNVDALGYLRGRYWLPIFAVKLGESGIRRSLVNQLGIISEDRDQFLGSDVPCLMSETGVPMDMNDGEPHRTGDYTPQIKALDAIAHATECQNFHVTYWAYSAENSYSHGDYWNGEDFSFMGSKKARVLEAIKRPFPPYIRGTVQKSVLEHVLYCESYTLVIDGEDCATASNPKDATIVFLPKDLFENAEPKVSAGRIEPLETDYIAWYHPAGEQQLTVSNHLNSSWCAII